MEVLVDHKYNVYLKLKNPNVKGQYIGSIDESGNIDRTGSMVDVSYKNLATAISHCIGCFDLRLYKFILKYF